MEFKSGEMTVMRGCENCNCDMIGTLFKIRSVSVNKVPQRCLQKKEYFTDYTVVGYVYVNRQRTVLYAFPLSHLFIYPHLEAWHGD